MESWTYSHAQLAALGVLDVEVLILKLLAVDGAATGAVATGEVATLGHEALDDAVEAGTSELAGGVVADAEGTEVLGRLGDDVGVELKGETAGGLAWR